MPPVLAVVVITLLYSSNLLCGSNNDVIDVFNNINHFKVTIMKDFEVVNRGVKYQFHFPTSLNEITPEYLNEVTKNVHIADDYSLVGIVYHEKLFDLIIARKQAKKSFSAAIVPIFIRAGKTDSEFIKSAKCKDKIITQSVNLNLSYHVAAPQNTLSIDYFMRAIDGDNSLAGRYNNNYGQEQCFFVEFKLIPNNEIVGFYTEATKVDSPYVDVQLESVEVGEV